MHYRAIPFAILLACSNPVPADVQSAAKPLYTPPADVAINVRAYGALGDAVTDDAPAFRAAFAAAVSSGADVYVPPGIYIVGRDGSAYYDLAVPSITLRGAGPSSVIRQSPFTPASVRMLSVLSADTVIQDLTLDGNATNQPISSEQRHGIFAGGANGRFERLVVRDFTGDGIYLYTGSTGARLYDVTSQDNHRNGVTFGGPIDAAWIRGGSYVRNLAQQIDSEPGYPGTVNNVTITDATVTALGNTYAITVSGTSSSTRSNGWTVARNTITGGVFVVWAEDVDIASNAITSTGAKPCIYVYRTNWKVLLAGNECMMTEPTGTDVNGVPQYPRGIRLTGTGGSSQPDGIRVIRNHVTSAAPSAIGIGAEACGDIVIEGNQVTGSGLPFTYAAGIYLRATDPTTPFRSATVVGNTIDHHGSRGISVRGNGAAQLLLLRAMGNTIGSDTADQSVGISPDDDGAHALQHGVYVENTYDTGVTSGRL